MMQTYRTMAVAVVLAALCAGPAAAAPPTVVPSPGYDARLQEQRAALRRAEAQRVGQPAHRRTHRAHERLTR